MRHLTSCRKSISELVEETRKKHKPSYYVTFERHRELLKR